MPKPKHSRTAEGLSHTVQPAERIEFLDWLATHLRCPNLPQPPRLHELAVNVFDLLRYVDVDALWNALEAPDARWGPTVVRLQPPYDVAIGWDLLKTRWAEARALHDAHQSDHALFATVMSDARFVDLVRAHPEVAVEAGFDLSLPDADFRRALEALDHDAATNLLLGLDLIEPSTH